MADTGASADTYRYSINQFVGDGSRTQWAFSFAGGYLSKDHVKARLYPQGGLADPISFTWVDDQTLSITPAVPLGVRFIIYRDTPKDKPLADFQDGAFLTETNLDVNARQAVFIAAEAQDTTTLSVKGDPGPPGSTKASEIQFSAPAANRTQAAKNLDVVSFQDWGITPDNPDNAAAMAALVAYLLPLAVNFAVAPRVLVPAGRYDYSYSPNWAIPGLHLDCAPGTIFHHTGSGRAFIVDGGATGPGVAMVKVTGMPVIRGNLKTLDGLYNRAIHHSRFDVEVQNCTVAAVRTEWAVCNEYRIRCSPLFRPAFNPTPGTGLYLDQRAPGEMTSACVFYNPILEGIFGYGINCANAVQNTFVGGTSESNVGGIYMSPSSTFNNVIGLDLEFNSLRDVFCLGAYNAFRNLLSDSYSEIGGTANVVDGGVFNSLADTGLDNVFAGWPRYASAGGTLTLRPTTTTVGVRNNTSGLLEPDRNPNPIDMLRVFGPNGSGLLVGQSDQVSGGLAGHTDVFKRAGGDLRMFVSGFKTLTLGPGQLGFFGSDPVPQPQNTLADATDLASAIALVNDLKSKLKTQLNLIA